MIKVFTFQPGHLADSSFRAHSVVVGGADTSVFSWCFEPELELDVWDLHENRGMLLRARVLDFDV